MESQHSTRSLGRKILNFKPVLATYINTYSSLSCIQKILDKAQGHFDLSLLNSKGFYFSENFTICFLSPMKSFSVAEMRKMSMNFFLVFYLYLFSCYKFYNTMLIFLKSYHTVYSRTFCET